ncbi:MAG: hypothetical protein H0W72_08355 [Planctomycetes bacterium]|nr:hypothetical protein [Planctomycetota bacterium]
MGDPRFLAIVAMAWSCVLPLAAVELLPRFTAARTGDLLTWELRGVDPAWLTFDVGATPSLVIDGPVGGGRRRACYLDQDHQRNPDGLDPELVAIGERVLRVRHVARVAGSHRWRLCDPAGTTLLAGEFTVVDGAGPPGPIGQSPHNPRLLAFSDGTPFIPIGPNIAWTKGPDRLKLFDRFFTALAAAGGTHTRMWLASWCGQFESAEPDRYRLDQAWLADGALALARARGLKVTVVIDNHHDFHEGLMVPYGATIADRLRVFMAPTPGAQYLRKLRYLLARWGADDTVMAWELFNELDLACPVRETALPWVAGATAAFARLDLDHRLCTVSWAGNDWDRCAAAGSQGLAQVHRYVLEWAHSDEATKATTRDGVGLLIGSARRADEIGRPFLFGEVGYQGTEAVNQGNDLDSDGLLLRQQAWAGFLVGSCGSGMGWWWDVYIDSLGLWSQYRPLATAVGLIDWRDRELSPLPAAERGTLRVLGWQGPGQALLWPQATSDTWYASLMEGRGRPQFPRPVKITLIGMRANARFAVQRLDMVDNALVPLADAHSDGNGRLPLEVPGDCGDYALILKAR